MAQVCTKYKPNNQHLTYGSFRVKWSGGHYHPFLVGIEQVPNFYLEFVGIYYTLNKKLVEVGQMGLKNESLLVT